MSRVPTPTTSASRVQSPGRAAAIAILAGTAGLFAALAWMPACGPAEPAAAPAPRQPRPEDTLLVVDGETITFGDVAAEVAYLDQLLPEYAERLKIQQVLAEYTLPLRFARRQFAAERQRQFELARTLKANCGHVHDLEQKSALDNRRRNFFVPGDFHPAVARFLFDPANTGAVSDPIEVPEGWTVVGAFDLQPDVEAVRTRCEAMLVAFSTHPGPVWRDWLAELRSRLATRVTFVHRDYVLALPPWMKLP